MPVKMTIKALRMPDRQAIVDKAAAALEVKAKAIGDFAADEYSKVVANWQHKLAFKPIITRQGGMVTMDVRMEGDAEAKNIWRYVNYGTGSKAGGSDYTIRPKRPGGVLSFNASYEPKTKPGGKYGGSGTRSGPLVRTEKARHAGITPRRFDLAIKKAVREYAKTQFGGGRG